MKKGCIYGLLDPLTYEIMYVGQTLEIEKRFYSHKVTGNSTHKVSGNIGAYLCALNDMGLIWALDYVVLEDGIPKNLLRVEEERWINRLRKTSPNLLNADGKKTSRRLPKEILGIVNGCIKRFSAADIVIHSGVPEVSVNRVCKKGIARKDTIIRVLFACKELLDNKKPQRNNAQRFPKKWRAFVSKLKVAA